MFILVYINNFLIISKDLNIINSLKKKLSKYFCIMNLGLVSYYLGMAVICIKNSIRLDQKSYLQKILIRFSIDICKLVSSPIDPEVLNSILPVLENQQVDKDTIFWYGAIMGLLMYTMTITCPDLEYALFIVS